MRKLVSRCLARVTRRVALLLVAATLPAHAGGPAMNYLMHCQGCHQADGSGQPGYVPDFRGSVARFLAVPDGRAYLGRVPGTSQSLLNDADRAAVLNYVVATFDPSHVPPDFSPYTAGELAVYRRDPISQASIERRRVLAQLSPDAAGSAASLDYRASSGASASSGSAAPASPPEAFAICAACHPVSPDGASAMGPNLRGVVGRRSGTLKGFNFSTPMKTAGITWSRDSLDRYLTDVQASVPGTLMTYPGVPEAADRAAIIGYLEALK